MVLYKYETNEAQLWGQLGYCPWPINKSNGLTHLAAGISAILLVRFLYHQRQILG